MKITFESIERTQQWFSACGRPGIPAKGWEWDDDPVVSSIRSQEYSWALFWVEHERPLSSEEKQTFIDVVSARFGIEVKR